MIRYKDFPNLIPPALETVTSIEELRGWLRDIGNTPEPSKKVAETVADVGEPESSEKIVEEIKKAYEERVTEEEDDKTTMEGYFKRLRQINDTANFIAAANIANISREDLLGIQE